MTITKSMSIAEIIEQYPNTLTPDQISRFEFEAWLHYVFMRAEIKHPEYTNLLTYKTPIGHFTVFMYDEATDILGNMVHITFNKIRSHILDGWYNFDDAVKVIQTNIQEEIESCYDPISNNAKI